jgi:hypothetical protein
MLLFLCTVVHYNRKNHNASKQSIGMVSLEWGLGGGKGGDGDRDGDEVCWRAAAMASSDIEKYGSTEQVIFA